MKASAHRRDFLKQAAVLATSAGVLSGPHALAAAPSEKLNLAVIGVGGRGGANLDGVSSQNIVALCDVDDARAGKAFERFPKAKKYADYRRMFDEMAGRIDGVVISTPDHTHFHPSHIALQLGKHVYLEKPMAHTVWEARELTRLAAEKKVATQLGIQRHTLPAVQQAVKIIQSGAIGPVRECHAWVGGDRGMPAKPTSFPPVPKSLDWDLWLGPVAERPYSPEFVPYKWRFWWDFGTGETGNWGCHILDTPYWALGLKVPTKVEAFDAAPDPERTPKGMTVAFEFPAERERPAMTLHWYHGTPPILAKLGLKGTGMNNLFIGAEGMLLCGFDRVQLLPEKTFKDFKVPAPPAAGAADAFYTEWFEACKGGKPATCAFPYSGPLSETVLLGNVAFRAAGGFTWDAARLKPIGNPKAAELIRPTFRKGWEV